MAMERQADPGGEAHTWRQGSPATIITVISPTNPGGTPNLARNPAPTEPRMAKPGAVMEWGPAPGIIGKPVPAAIGIHPMSAVEVRLPAGVDYNHIRLPAPTV